MKIKSILLFILLFISFGACGLAMEPENKKACLTNLHSVLEYFYNRVSDDAMGVVISFLPSKEGFSAFRYASRRCRNVADFCTFSTLFAYIRTVQALESFKKYNSWLSNNTKNGDCHKFSMFMDNLSLEDGKFGSEKDFCRVTKLKIYGNPLFTGEALGLFKKLESFKIHIFGRTFLEETNFDKKNLKRLPENLKKFELFKRIPNEGLILKAEDFPFVGSLVKLVIYTFGDIVFDKNDFFKKTVNLKFMLLAGTANNFYEQDLSFLKKIKKVFFHKGIKFSGKQLEVMNNLRELIISECNSMFSAVKFFKNLTNLYLLSIDLGEENYPEEIIEKFENELKKGIPSLKKLYIRGAENLKGDFLPYLKNLEEFEFVNCSRISNDNLEKLLENGVKVFTFVTDDQGERIRRKVDQAFLENRESINLLGDRSLDSFDQEFFDVV